MSTATHSQLWNMLWRSNRRNKETRIDTIIMPIKVHNIHWYIASVHIGEKVVNFNIRNNTDMRDKTAEDKLLKIARQYQVEMSTQKSQKELEVSENCQTTTEIQIVGSSTSDKNTSEYTLESHNRDTYLHRTRQSKNKSHCVMPAVSKYDDISSKEDTEEEVIYSEGETFEGYPYPNNTWDSQDSLYEDENKVSGWI